MKNKNVVFRLRRSWWDRTFKYNRFYKNLFIRKYGRNIKQLKINQPQMFCKEFLGW